MVISHSSITALTVCLCTLTALTVFSHIPSGVCIGSSTNHVVTFDGITLKLEGFCSYSLLQVDGPAGVEVLLHNGPCQTSQNQICMKTMEVKSGDLVVLLKDDMTVGLDFHTLPSTWPIRVVYRGRATGNWPLNCPLLSFKSYHWLIIRL